SGVSAGAHLSLLYAYTKKDDSPINPVAACVYCPPVSCWKSDFLLGISGEFEDWKYSILSKCCGFPISRSDFQDELPQKHLRKMSPDGYVSKNCVPTALFHGKNDNLIPPEHIHVFMAALKDAGVKNDLLIYENSDHALKDDPRTADIARDIFRNYVETYF
ncbi:MAG: prolyl oligopeptidase family serine peptidase, partial [Clostridia bacterium]|nr:prolyl oligopeptidase family serine peptidase [Clostridia bacterium]